MHQLGKSTGMQRYEGRNVKVWVKLQLQPSRKKVAKLDRASGNPAQLSFNAIKMIQNVSKLHEKPLQIEKIVLDLFWPILTYRQKKIYNCIFLDNF